MPAALAGVPQHQNDFVPDIIDPDQGVLVSGKACDGDVVERADDLVGINQCPGASGPGIQGGQVDLQIPIQTNAGGDIRGFEGAGMEFGNLAQSGCIRHERHRGVVMQPQGGRLAVATVEADLRLAAGYCKAAAGQIEAPARCRQQKLRVLGHPDRGFACERSRIGKPSTCKLDGQQVAVAITVDPDLACIVDLQQAAGLGGRYVASDFQLARRRLQLAEIAKDEIVDRHGFGPEQNPVPAQIDAVAILGAGKILGGPIQPVVPANAVGPIVRREPHHFGLGAQGGVQAKALTEKRIDHIRIDSAVQLAIGLRAQVIRQIRDRRGRLAQQFRGKFLNGRLVQSIGCKTPDVAVDIR